MGENLNNSVTVADLEEALRDVIDPELVLISWIWD